jgi:type VI secretion system FHA domain protein
VDPLQALFPAPDPILRGGERESQHGAWPVRDPIGGNVLSENAGIGPPRLSQPQAIPADWDNPNRSDREPPASESKGRREAVPHTPRPVGPVRDEPPNPPAGGSSPVDLNELLSGAGLEGVRLTPEIAQQLGAILRVVVEGVLDVLHARQQTKEAFRIPGTVIRARGNNPLKHSVDVQDALHNLLVRRSAGYLGPVEAFEDAFADLRNHQLAVLAGIRAAFQTMLERFEPDCLRERFDRAALANKKGPLARLQGGPDYWAMYCEWVQGLLQDNDGTFRSLFGEVFSDAYEDQLRRLRAQGRTDEGGRS